MTARLRLKSTVARALAASGSDRLIGHLTRARRLPLVVGYHRVVEPAGIAEPSTIRQLSVSLPTFERQLEWIGRRYRFVSLDELADQLESGVEWTEPVATITFDDGYADVYENALPILSRRAIPAAIFVVTDWIGSAKLLDHDRLYRLLVRGWPRSLKVAMRGGFVGHEGPASAFSTLRHLLRTRSQRELVRICEVLEEELSLHEEPPPSLRPLTWEMLATWRRAGMIVGSHTVSHPVLTREGPPKVFSEVRDSRSALEQRLGEPIRYFAYPDGAYDVNVVRAVASAGYRLALTACLHRSPEHPSLTISRRLFWENTSLDSRAQFSPAILSCLANGAFDLIAGCRDTHRTSAVARH